MITLHEKTNNKVQNLSEYSLEKLDKSIEDIEKLLGRMLQYKALLQSLDNNEVMIEGDIDFAGSLRHPNGPFGSESAIKKLRVQFESRLYPIEKQMSAEMWEAYQKECEKYPQIKAAFME